MQKKISELLNSNFQPHKRSYAFTKDKNIVQNASLHVGKKYVLNLDIKDFFPSISFGRVRYMFINYFKLNKNIATILAKICCHPGNDKVSAFLPQGGASSPVISNILCKTLDKDFINLCSQFKGITYSRYADDITLSTNQKFSKKLITIQTNHVQLEDQILNIFKKNYFEVNNEKVRLRSKYERQTVTGIKVNEKLNLNRKYIKEIKAILWSLDINFIDPSIVIKKFEESQYSNKLPGIDGIFAFLKGRIDFLGCVRGISDNIYVKFLVQYNSLVDVYELDKGFKIRKVKAKKQNVFVIPEKKIEYWSKKSNALDSTDYGQGTAFMLKEVGMISNYHVFEYLIEAYLEGEIHKKYLENIVFFDSRNPVNRMSCRIIKYSKIHDLVILEINENECMEVVGFERANNYSKSQNIKILGHPRYTVKDEINKDIGTIKRVDLMKANHTSRFEITCSVISGNSGGPVLNIKNQVLGVVSQGNGSYPNLAIPINYIDSLKLIK